MNKFGAFQAIPLKNFHLLDNREKYLKHIKDGMYCDFGLKLSEKIPIIETEKDGDLELRLECYVFTPEQLREYRNQVIHEFTMMEKQLHGSLVKKME